MERKQDLLPSHYSPQSHLGGHCDSPRGQREPGSLPSPAPRLHIPIQREAQRPRVGKPGEEDKGGDRQGLLRPPEAPRPAPGPRSPSPATSSRGDARPAEEAGTSREAWGVGSACTRIIPTHHPHASSPRQGGLPAATRCSGDGGPTPRHPRHGPCEGSWGAGRLGRVAWMGAVGWVLRGLGGCGFGGYKDGGLRGWLGWASHRGNRPRWEETALQLGVAKKR